MEIKRTVLPPFGGPREESGANGSLWSMGGGIIGSPASPISGFIAADETLTNVTMTGYNDGVNFGWGFYAPGHNVAVGDWIRVSGFSVPSGAPFLPGTNVNGDWEIDWTNGIDAFSSPALRSRIGNVDFMSDPSAFGSGTVLVDQANPPPLVIAYGPSQNWTTENVGAGSSITLFSSSYPDQDPEWAAILANPTAYKVVIAGGPIAGTYPIGWASAFGPTAPGVTILSLYPENTYFIGYDITSNLIGLETSEMSYWVNAGRTPVAGTASIVLA